MSDLEEAIDQLARAVQHPLDRAVMYGLIDHEGWRRPPRAFAERVVFELASDEEHLAAEAALTVMEWICPGDHLQVTTDWWATPLGRLTWRASPQALYDPPRPGTVDVYTAMALLGLSRPRIYQLLDEGRLTRAGRGLIDQQSLERLLEKRATQ